MPDSSAILGALPGASAAIAAGRAIVYVYAAVATALTTACLTVQAMAVMRRRLTRRNVPPAARSPFLRLGAERE